MVVWQYADEQGRWRDMRPTDCHSLEAAFRLDHNTRVELPLGPYGFRYVMDLTIMHQINLRTGLRRRLRRRVDSSSPLSPPKQVVQADAVSEVASTSDMTAPPLSPRAQIMYAQQLSTPLSSSHSLSLDSPLRGRSRSDSCTANRSRGNLSVASLGSCSEPRTPGPATYDTSKNQKALTPRSTVFGSTQRNTGDALRQGDIVSKAEGLDTPGPQTYNAVKAWESCSRSRSSSSARMRSPRQTFLLEDGRVFLGSTKEPSPRKLRPGPQCYDTRKHKVAITPISSATFGRAVRLPAHNFRTPTTSEEQDFAWFGSSPSQMLQDSREEDSLSQLTPRLLDDDLSIDQPVNSVQILQRSLRSGNTIASPREAGSGTRPRRGSRGARQRPHSSPPERIRSHAA